MVQALLAISLNWQSTTSASQRKGFESHSGFFFSSLSLANAKVALTTTRIVYTEDIHNIFFLSLPGYRQGNYRKSNFNRVWLSNDMYLVLK